MDFMITQQGVLHAKKADSLLFNTSRPVYEVIRVIDGTALFLEDHYKRLVSSIKIRGLEFEMEFSEFRKNIAKLAKLNRIQNGNVKFVLYEVDKIIHWSFSFISHSYPTPIDYQNGVATGLFFAERENPNAKIIQNAVSGKANELIADKKVYEVLLVDRNGMITEGSRSNVFFVKDNQFYTAPASKVLVGVTRKKVMECLNELHFTIVEEAVPASETGTFDAVFLTGTSPKVLPVNCIDTLQFEVKNSFVEQLMDKYNSIIETYLKSQED